MSYVALELVFERSRVTTIGKSEFDNTPFSVRMGNLGGMRKLPVEEPFRELHKAKISDMALHSQMDRIGSISPQALEQGFVLKIFARHAQCAIPHAALHPT